MTRPILMGHAMNGGTWKVTEVRIPAGTLEADIFRVGQEALLRLLDDPNFQTVAGCWVHHTLDDECPNHALPEHEKQVAFKITHGYVRQDFVEGKCVGQEFIAAGDPVAWENEVGEAIDPDYEGYHPFTMLEPGHVELLNKLNAEIAKLGTAIKTLVAQQRDEAVAQSAVDTIIDGVKKAAQIQEGLENE